MENGCVGGCLKVLNGYLVQVGLLQFIEPLNGFLISSLAVGTKNYS